MHSISTWCTLLAAISAPLVATAHSVIDTHADGAGVSGEAFAIQAVTDDTLVSDTLTLDNSLISDAIFTGGLELSDEEEEHHHLRRLLRRRKRGTSKASPRVPKKSRKKSPKKSPKKSSKKKSSKKKSPKKKVSRKKKPSPKKKRTTAKAPSRSKGSGKTIGVQRKGHGTHFAGMGSPTGGCGVPPGKAFDDNGKALPFVALNFNSEFASGSNCGRWVEIELGANCINAGNSQFSICNGGQFVRDGISGGKIYGYVMDSCDDNNFWCRTDRYHLDISRPYLSGLGLTSGKKWNGREIFWKYMTGTPPGWKMSQPKFMWKSGSKWKANGKGFYAAVVIYNTDNGIRSVEQMSGNKWVKLSPLQHLGNMWVLQRPPDSEYRSPSGGSGKSIKLRVTDAQGKQYGSYSVSWMCGSGVCSSEVDAPAKKIG